MPGFLKSVQIAFRSLRRRPSLTLVAILTLGLGIGASTAIYTVLQATLLSPPPFAEPDQLVALWGVMPKREIDRFPASPPQIEVYRLKTRLFEDVAGYSGNNHVFRRQQQEPEQVRSLLQTWNLFRLLGVTPLLGRDFSADDARFNQSEVPAGTQPPNNVFNPSKVVILGYEFWKNRFGSDLDVVDSQVYLDELPVTIIGVMPPDLKVLLHGQVAAFPDFFEVLRVDNQNASMVNVFLNGIGRLKPGVTIQQAESEINAVTAVIAESEPILKTNKLRIRLVPLQQELTKDIRAVVWVLAGAVAFILLIACANVSNLLLIRASERSSEQSIRVALGSSRFRLLTDSLIETGLLALGGTISGVAIAYATLPALVTLQPENIPQLSGLQVDMTVLLFGALAAIATTLLAGSIPALTTMTYCGHTSLRGRGASQQSRASGRWRNALIIGEVALSFVLLIGAGLMSRSFYELQVTDPGFDPSGVLTFTYNFPNARYPDPQSQLNFHQQFELRLRALSGVEAVGGVFPLPLTGGNFGSRYAADLETFTDGSARQAQYRSVYPGYFEAVKATLITGRTFTDQDQREAARYAVINEAIARRTWPDESPLGKRIYMRGATPDPVALEVIGVVGNEKQRSLDEAPVETLYAPNSLFSAIGFGTATFWAVRVQGTPQNAVPEIAAVLKDLDREMPMQFVDTLENIVQESTAPTRFSMALLGIFSGVATFLAGVGLYGALAYQVRQRRPELGIRLAFGAPRSGIFGIVVRHGLLLAAGGLGIGLLAALGLKGAMTSLLVGVTPTDPMTYAATAVFFGLIAGISCLLPAYRATRVDPAEALRQQ